MLLILRISFGDQRRNCRIAQAQHQQADAGFFDVVKNFGYIASKFFAVRYKHNFPNCAFGGFQSLYGSLKCRTQIGAAHRNHIAIQLLNALFQTHPVAGHRTRQIGSAGKRHDAESRPGVLFYQLPQQPFAVFQPGGRHVLSKHTARNVKNDQNIGLRHIEFQRPLPPAGPCRRQSQQHQSRQQQGPPPEAFGIRYHYNCLPAHIVFKYHPAFAVAVNPPQQTPQHDHRQQP